jgi:hypothetical protein
MKLYCNAEPSPRATVERAARRRGLQRHRRVRRSPQHHLHDGHRARRKTLQGRRKKQERREEELRGLRSARTLRHRLLEERGDG